MNNILLHSLGLTLTESDQEEDYVDTCRHHLDIDKNQTEIKVHQTEIKVHLMWMRKAVTCALVLMCTCLGAIGTIAYNLSTVGAALNVQAQVSRELIGGHSKELVELRDMHKELCRKVEGLHFNR